MTCEYYGHAMSPHYVFHKAGKNRRKASFVCHYVCAQYRKYGAACDHSNRVLADTSEGWLLERMRDLATFEDMTERALDWARRNYESRHQPEKEALTRTQAALQENQAQIDALVKAVSAGGATPELIEMLGEGARELKLQRERLRRESGRLRRTVLPVESRSDEEGLRGFLSDFPKLAQEAETGRIAAAAAPGGEGRTLGKRRDAPH